MEGLTPVHLIIVLVIALLILGPGKLPETGAALGRAVRDFRRGMTDDVTTASPGGSAADQVPPPTSPPPSAS